MVLNLDREHASKVPLKRFRQKRRLYIQICLVNGFLQFRSSVGCENVLLRQ